MWKGPGRWEAPARHMHTCAGMSNAKAVVLPQDMALGPHIGIWLFSVSSDPGQERKQDSPG